jgi:hypothetical protein
MAKWEKLLTVDEFEPIWSGHRTNVEINRTIYTDYKIGDTVYFKEYDENRKTIRKYTGRSISVRVLSIVNDIVEFVVTGLDQINVFQYVDSNTYKKYMEDK